MVFDPVELAAFFALRERTFRGIAAALSVDGHCKSGEGTFSIVFPNYFENQQGRRGVEIVLWCYVLGQSREHRWFGAILGEAVDRARLDIDRWSVTWETHLCDEGCLGVKS